MKHILALVLMLLCGQARAQISMTACYLSGSSTACLLPVNVASGGTGVATLASNGVLYGNGTGVMQVLAVNSTGTNKFLTDVSSGAPAWNTIVAADVPSIDTSKLTTGTLGVARGGIGVGTLASNGVLYGNGTGAVNALAVNSSGTNEFLTQSSSGTPAWAALIAGDVPNLDASKITTGLLAIARGGTNTGTATGSGNLVLATAPTITTPTITSPTISGNVASSPGTTQSLGTASNAVQTMTPSADITVTLDNTFLAGQTVTITNKSATKFISVASNTGTTDVIRTVYPNTSATMLCITASPADKSGWDVLGTASSNWISFTPTISAVSTPPTLATSKTLTGFWRRTGTSMEYSVYYSQAATTGAANGSGSYIFLLPTNPITSAAYAVDGTNLPANGAGSLNDQFTIGCLIRQASNFEPICWLDYASSISTTGFRLVVESVLGTETVVGSATGFGPADNSNTAYYVRALIPISGWTGSKG